MAAIPKSERTVCEHNEFRTECPKCTPAAAARQKKRRIITAIVIVVIIAAVGAAFGTGYLKI